MRRFFMPIPTTRRPCRRRPPRTIGDALDAKHVDWVWYSGAWDAALADGRRPPFKPRTAIYAPDSPGGNPDFQPHHQPFNYLRALRSRSACRATCGTSEGLPSSCSPPPRADVCRPLRSTNRRAM
jgi:phospholipase C